jgi:hypothetical protein
MVKARSKIGEEISTTNTFMVLADNSPATPTIEFKSDLTTQEYCGGASATTQDFDNLEDETGTSPCTSTQSTFNTTFTLSTVTNATSYTIHVRNNDYNGSLSAFDLDSNLSFTIIEPTKNAGGTSEIDVQTLDSTATSIKFKFNVRSYIPSFVVGMERKVYVVAKVCNFSQSITWDYSNNCVFSNVVELSATREQ